MAKRAKNTTVSLNEFVSTAKFGKLLRNLKTGKLGVTKSRVHQLIEQGVITEFKRDPNFGNILIAKSEAKRINKLDRHDGGSK